MNWGHLSAIEIVILIFLILTLILDIAVWITEIKELRMEKNSDGYKTARQQLPHIILTSIGSVLIIVTCFIQLQPLRLILVSIACVLISVALGFTVKRSNKKKKDEKGKKK